MHLLGVVGMPRRIPDYPDAFNIFNKTSTGGSYTAGVSVLVFFVLLDALVNTKIVDAFITFNYNKLIAYSLNIRPLWRKKFL